MLNHQTLFFCFFNEICLKNSLQMFQIIVFYGAIVITFRDHMCEQTFSSNSHLNNIFTNFAVTTMKETGEVSIVVTTNDQSSYLTPVHYSSRRNTASQDELGDMVQSSRRPSGIVALHRPSIFMAQRKFIMDLFASPNGSSRSLNAPTSVLKENHMASVQKMRNRRMGK